MDARSKHHRNQWTPGAPRAVSLLEDDDYAALPEPIRMNVSPREYLFMTDAQKASIIQDDCEPEY